MPCETCHVQFTVFRRKRICFDCRCFFCSNCLTANRRNIFLCQRCAIFAKRPLLRSDLLQLKPKDLIFYLQSKHISTSGCVEKEELVGLILTHVEQVGDTYASNGPTSPNGETSNSFDSLKQTCQNFFSNISDNISDSFATFDSKPTTKTSYRQNYRRTSGDTNPSHIFEQPRVSTRELPTYASFQNTQLPRTQPSSNTSIPSNRDTDENIQANSSSSGATVSTPSASTSTHSTSQARCPNTNAISVATLTARQSPEDDKSECECSDDEIITTFSERLSVKTETSGQASSSRPTVENLICQGPSTTTSTSPGYSKQNSISSKVDICGVEVSSHSSFEELGAIGGISDESKATTDTNSNSNTDQWQMLDAQKPETSVADDKQVATESPTNNAIDKNVELAQQPNQNAQETQEAPTQPPCVPQRTKKIMRRRSDGYLNRHNHSSDDESPIGVRTINLATLTEHTEGPESTTRSNCERCGKNKTSIKQNVDRMRRHLESSQMSEEHIKYELKEFLSYLEQRTRSIDCSDQESRAVSSLSDMEGLEFSSVAGGIHTATPNVQFSPSNVLPDFDGNDGIHVYPASEEFEAATSDMDSRFINLNDFDNFKELENLTVKQLKEILMLHRVDYKGCCEKQELLDRVTRLWKNLRSAPAVEKLATDELCKICMDAPIECVFLECGHMATCTKCGKVLNECPICRQYIVRVVRFFRA